MGRIVGITYPKPAEPESEQQTGVELTAPDAEPAAAPEQSEKPQLPDDEPEEMLEEPETKTAGKKAGRK